MSAAIGLSAIDFLRLYIIDRLGSAVLHDARNAVQAIIGHTTLMQAQLASLTISSELPGKLLLAAERCGRSTSDVNTIFAIPTQRQSTVRLTGLLREQLSFFQGLLRDRNILNVQLNQKIDGVRIQQQPFIQLILLWIIRARDFIPSGGQMVLQVLSQSEASTLSDSLVQEPDRFIPFRLHDDGRHFSRTAQRQLTNPTPGVPDDAESMLCWLFGSLLQEVQAVCVLAADSPTFQMDVLWPKVYLPTQAR